MTLMFHNVMFRGRDPCSVLTDSVVGLKLRYRKESVGFTEQPSCWVVELP